ncbi:hypothetical protein GJAV_G00084500 [Gymnothorax javanicus]|nr:hypothetical protein GJAV_G00084500 [Gymnothorax javanicus]
MTSAWRCALANGIRGTVFEQELNGWRQALSTAGFLSRISTKVADGGVIVAGENSPVSRGTDQTSQPAVRRLGGGERLEEEDVEVPEVARTILGAPEDSIGTEGS